MIEFACKHCQQSIRLSNNKAGITGRCPHCTHPVTVPTASELPLHDDVFVEFEPVQSLVFQSSTSNGSADLGSRSVALASKVVAWFFGLLFLGLFLTSVWRFPLVSLPALAGASLLIPPIYQRVRSIFGFDVGVQLKVIGSGALFICYMMMFASATSNESAERSKLAEKQAEQQRQTERELTAQYLKSNKAAIQAEANAFIEQGKVAEALNVVRNYQGLGDADIDAVAVKVELKNKTMANEAKKTKLVESLGTIKDDNISERARIYEQLVALAPDNAGYKKQLTELNTKVAQAAAKKKAEEEAATLKAHQRQMGLVWRYGTHNDEMTQKEVLTAEVDSINTLSFGFPYSGAQRATLELRKHPRWGSDVILQVERGQFLCNSYDGCSVSVRFGGGKPQRFSASEPSDNSTTYLFISDYRKFMSQLRKVDEVVIEASFYQSGNQALKFSTADLDWK
ncbi:zinc ribbon domain-containing protein [Pseudomonas sp. MDT1-16]